MSQVSRRRFLKGLAAVAGGTALAACAPQIVKETVVVQVPVEKTVIETVVVEKAVEKRVVETVVVTEEKIVEVEAAPEESQTLRLLSLKGVGWKKANDVLIDSFESSTPHKIDFEEVQWPIRETLIPYMAAGTPPHVFHDMAKMQMELFQEGAFLDLDQLLDDDPNWTTDDVIPVDLEACTWVDGKLKHVPLWHNLTVGTHFAYRGDFFDEAGIPRPEKADHFGDSFADWYTLGQKLTKKDASGNVTTWGLRNGLQWTGFRVYGLILEQGGHWWDEANQVLTLNTPELINAVQTLFLDPVFEYGITPDDEHAIEFSYDLALAEGAAAMDHVEWAIGICEDKGMEVCEVMDWAECPNLNPALKSRVNEGTWGCGLPKGIPANSITPAFKVATEQFKGPVAAAFHKFCGPPSGMKFYMDSPYPEMVAGAAIYGACTTAKAIWERDNNLKFCGWDMGDVAANFYFLDGSFHISEAAGLPEDARETCLSGRWTAEQIAEIWQDYAEKKRKEFWGL